MLRGIYTATSGMLTAQRDINVRSNNLANLSTAGFKSDRLVATTFAEAIAIRQQPRTIGRHEHLAGGEQPRNAAWRVGDEAWEEQVEAALGRITLSRGRTALKTMTNFAQGSLELTERALDFAIDGDGFFIIQSNRGVFDEADNPFGVHNGVYYTRNGQFQLNGEGYLVNGRGEFVLDDMGYTIWLGTDNFHVTSTGEIFLNGEYEVRLGIFVPDNPHLLFKNGEDIFTSLNDDFAPEEVEEGFTGIIRQRFIERANTDIAAEMAGMMLASRSFQSMSQVLRAIDSLLQRSISEVGRV